MLGKINKLFLSLIDRGFGVPMNCVQLKQDILISMIDCVHKIFAYLRFLNLQVDCVQVGR